MSKIRATDTQPELKLRKYLHKLGFRYRLHYPVAGKPDLVFPKYRIAVFIHGCFWHQHGCKNSVIPKTNTDFWLRKLTANVSRDKAVCEKLAVSNWQVITIWECELEDRRSQALNRLADHLSQQIRENYKKQKPASKPACTSAIGTFCDPQDY